MNRSLPSKLLAAVIVATLLISCLQCAGGGIDGSGYRSQGPISDFGSIVVNGEEFDTQSAALFVNGDRVGVGDDVLVSFLDVGRVVTVAGYRRWYESETAPVSRVIYNDSVKGPVESIEEIDPAAKAVGVMGQTVIVNAVTVFEGTSFDTIATGDILSVSGLFDDTAIIWATYVGKTGSFTPGTEVEIEGYVANLDAAASTFEINNLVVNYTLADIGELPRGILTDGQFVEVSGILEAVGGEMQATRIRPGDDIEASEVDQIEVTGFVTDLSSTSEFRIGNLRIRANSNTVFVDISQAEIVPGIKLEAEGRLVAGVLVASEIEFWEPDQIEIEGTVTAIASDTEFTVDDQAVRTDADTVFEDLGPDEIELGMTLEIKGVPVDIDRSVIIADKVSLEEE